VISVLGWEVGEGQIRVHYRTVLDGSNGIANAAAVFDCREPS